MNPVRNGRSVFFSLLTTTAALLAGGAMSLLAVCGPFTDTANDGFCPFVLEIFYSGITTGTTPTTYDPSSPVTRLQMAAFLSRTVDLVVKKANRRTAHRQNWTTKDASALGLTTVAAAPQFVESDGEDVWVSHTGGTVTRIHASDGRVLGTWSGAASGQGVLSAMGRVLVAGASNPGRLYQIDPGAAPGAVTTVASNLGQASRGITFDGQRVWTANNGSGNTGGSVSIITPGASIPWSVTTVTSGFSAPEGALFDGTNVWVTDSNAGTLLKLSSSGAILQTVTVQSTPRHPVYDGVNIWVPASNGRISVVRAATGAILGTASDGAIGSGFQAAFDGQRVLVTHDDGSTISVWKAADLSEIGVVDPGQGTNPLGVCSNGLHFWLVLSGPGQLARF